MTFAMPLRGWACGLLIFALLLLSPVWSRAEVGLGELEPLRLERVIDGDTVELKGGERLRYVGIDTPELDETLGREAKERNRQLVEGMTKKVFFRRCMAQGKDEYGRILGFVQVGKKDIQATLLQEGLALPMSIPPCGLLRVDDYYRLAAAARRRKIGLWNAIEGRELSPGETPKALRTYRGVRGRVMTVYEGPDQLYLNFGMDWRKDFSIVIARTTYGRFKSRGIDPVRDFRGRELRVYGFIEQHKGPLIRVHSPYQIEVEPTGKR